MQVRSDWLSEVRPDDASPRQPELPPELERIEIDALSHDATFTDIEVVQASLVDQHANGVTLGTVGLSSVDLSGSRLEHLSIADAALTGCSLANVQGRSARVTRALIEGSRLTGFVLSEAALTDVTFRGCRADLASFGFSHLVRVTFEDCLLAQTDFLDARLDAVRFLDCDLSRADFRGARLEGCEFRRCDLAGVEGAASLRGAAFEWPAIVAMAGTWAAALGIEVLDDD
jgi:uncharacterized protein YjbI with pentapeptide repeats